MANPLANYASPDEAAAIIGCTNGRIYQLLKAKAFRDVLRIGKRMVLVSKKEAVRIAREPAKTGRPRKFSPA